MPFYKSKTDQAEPDVRLQQVGPNDWKLTNEFWYLEPERGDDGWHRVRAARTDLASVKWPVWWLVASYGRHTKAALLHDELIPDKPGDETAPDETQGDGLSDLDHELAALYGANSEPTRERLTALRERLARRAAAVQQVLDTWSADDETPRRTVSRKEADRLFFVALQESSFGNAKPSSWARRWLMWSGVAVLGTMRANARWRSFFFLGHVLLFVGLAAYLVATAADEIWAFFRDRVFAYFEWVAPPFDWAASRAATAASHVSDVASTPWASLPWQPSTGVATAIATAVVGAVGFVWARDPQVDRKLGKWLFLWAAFAVVVVPLPAVLAILANRVVWALDLVRNVAVAIAKLEFNLKDIIPIGTPYRGRGMF